jgi:hypothetical protein
MLKWRRLLRYWLASKPLKEVKEAHCRVSNSWRSLCNVEFNPCNTVFPSFGAILDWWILLASLET